MKKTFLSLSVFALALSGVPAIANESASATTPRAERIGADKIGQKLGDAGVESRADFKGKLVRAQTPEGHPVMFVFGPENLAGDEDIDFRQDRVRGRLTEAAFSRLEFIDDESIVRGELGDKAVLAFTAEHGWRGVTGPAEASTPDADRLNERLGEVGFEDRESLDGSLLRASSGGQSIFVLMGPQDFSGGGSVALSAKELSDFQSAFENAELIESVTLRRGTIGGQTVVAISGSGIAPDVNTPR
ncbi:hypothetical protein [Aquabacter spiritensis]|uniref:Uncharacterized protein n=1 Tax=Aquabacter spiritensis TaxID=933073 RepID=A0A4R3M5U3_9HYPH|nr:hypothetical protein [Aquabacter spiritensis]TCT08306.1 hypothetical protein EDC64_101830 [Aquabacter spiritensis]